ncbi:hypothetical protein KHC28_11350 [Ancylobacter sonchi]|uniref:hypothetical protein n=1 Tax=Ancylobacter sonchi TaxID=1937790 RepID=UPI001BD6ADED|nr:hypothetical protein [Ancylobacter sonchi]MBS7534254.1 hypothetical protein [Ancylobacter sonchi]
MAHWWRNEIQNFGCATTKLPLVKIGGGASAIHQLRWWRIGGAPPIVTAGQEQSCRLLASLNQRIQRSPHNARTCRLGIADLAGFVNVARADYVLRGPSFGTGNLVALAAMPRDFPPRLSRIVFIGEHGMREPIWLYDGKILDGRNRYRAAMQAEMPIGTQVYDGDDPLAFVVSLNLKRRHLSESQRAMVAARLASMRQGERTDIAQIQAMSQDDAASMLNVSRRAVQTARQVQSTATPDLTAANDNAIDVEEAA